MIYCSNILLPIIQFFNKKILFSSLKIKSKLYMTIELYHTTKLGNAELIVQNGWKVTYSGINIYGRGIYFWEKYEDAHNYGMQNYGKENYEILSEDIPIHSNNSIVYDYKRARNSHIDQIAQSLLKRGIEVIIISNPKIKDSTMQSAKGKAYLWLVDMNHEHRIVYY